MPLFHVSVRHGRTESDARGRLAEAVDQVRGRFGPVVQRVEWSPDRDAATVAAAGVVLTMRVDPEEVHVSGEIPVLGTLLGRPVEAGVRQIVQQTFARG